MKPHGIFFKTFIYTAVSILLLVVVTAALFSQQFKSFYRTIQNRQIVASYEPLERRIQRTGSIVEAAERFYENNQSFEFIITDKNGGLIFATPNAEAPDSFDGDFFYVVHNAKDYTITAQSRTGLESFYQDLIIRGSLVFVVIFALCLICAYVFARKMTTPIKQLADSAGRMASLEDVPPPQERQDELGALARDVHFMYGKLKETISQLEDEILRVREMEETQRYFFSAASHELKTPIAATSVLLEGMLENVGDYKDHSKYLRECIKMMDAQSEKVSEILEIVRLDDGKVTPVPERIDIRNMVTGLLPEFQTITDAGGQRMVVDIPDGQICFSNSKMLQKALSNIIVNAVQNTPAGGEIRIWSELIDKQYRLCVLNTGARIDEADLPKLFDPFYRADKARERKDKRSGLGLTLVRKTLETMNIPYALENAPDGVLFWMNLPME